MSTSRINAPKKRRSRHRYSDIPVLTPSASPVATQFNAYSARRNGRDTADISPRSAYSITPSQGRVPLAKNHTGDAESDSELLEDPQGQIASRSEEEGPSSDDSASAASVRSGDATISVLQEHEETELEFDEDSEHRRPQLSSWKVLWGLFNTNGSRKLTKNQYQSVRILAERFLEETGWSWKNGTFIDRQVSEMGKIRSLPHYTTLQKKYRPFVLKSLAPRGILLNATVDTSKAGARRNSMSLSGTQQERITVIPPSEYARADICTKTVWEQFVKSSLTPPRGADCPKSSTFDCTDMWPLVAARDLFYGQPRMLRLDNDGAGASSFAEVGDVLKVTLLRNSPSVLAERLCRCFHLEDNSAADITLQGVIVHTWNVHHPKRRGDALFEQDVPSNLTAMDRQIVANFSHVAYTSPSVAVDVQIPEIPLDQELGMEELDGDIVAGMSVRRKRRSPEVIEALKARRQAIKRKKIQIEQAWRNWSKPILKPGDFIVMLRPCANHEYGVIQESYRRPVLTSVDSASRVLVVTRFWIENEERSRHLLWIDGGKDLDTLTPCPAIEEFLLRSNCSTLFRDPPHCLLSDIRKLTVTKTHQGPRGFEKFAPVPSLGTLANGESYFIYRFLIFWDGFEIAKRKSASGEGVYLLCLNLPPAARSSPSAIRILSATPPGVSVNVVFENLIAYIVEGISTGFLDFDAEGNQRRIFLDLVGFIGDTIALNQVLDTLGHTGVACCHLCRFVRRASTTVGSRYAENGSHGMLSSTLRNYYNHTAVRDSEPSEETLRLLGMKPIIPAATDILLRLRKAMFQERTRIPKTSKGIPVVPHVLDPYRACIIAPDHLLTGHFKDCMSLVLRLLPSRRHCTTWEVFMLDFLRGAKLPTQNRLVDHAKKALYAMSISELYSLSVVAHDAILAGCSSQANSTELHHDLSVKCKEAIELLGSCSRLISEFCQSPRCNMDGFLRIASFEDKNGSTRVQLLQSMTEAHLAKVTSVCRMHDADLLLLDDSICPRNTRNNLSRTYQEALIAVRTIDKPNVHRLRELAFCTLPMVVQITRIGELVFEKTHQVLKRAVSLSNKKNVQVHAMNDAVVGDWQGRLTLLAQDAFSSTPASVPAVGGCFRLLCGREALISTNGKVRDEDFEFVRRVLGSPELIRKELHAQGQTVLAPRAISSNTAVNWTLEGAFDIRSASDSASTNLAKVMDTLRIAYGSEVRQICIQAGDAAYSRYSADTECVRLKRGDVLELLCYNPRLFSFHRPFVVQFNGMPRISSWERSTGPSLWSVVLFVSLTLLSGEEKLLAAVLPCFTSDEASVYPDRHRFTAYRVDLQSPISLAILNDSVRRAGVLHACLDFQCHPTQDMNSISHTSHSETLLGSSFLALTRQSGYPPRRD